MTTQVELLKKYGLSVRGISGQHILIDPNIQKKIVDTLSPGPKDKVLEIGPGLGALTLLILKHGAHVTAVEKDPRFAEILAGELGMDYKNRLTIVNRDILEVKLSSLRKKGDKAGEWKLISNLPYYVTAPILFHVFESRRMFSKAILMMQKEVAKRLIALPGSKDYGRLTLAAKYCADTKILFHVTPGCFSPRPDVDSSVVELEFHPDSKLPFAGKEHFLFRLIQVAFGQRRKTLMHLLMDAPDYRLTREGLKQIFRKLDFPEKVRGEELLLKDYFKLADALSYED